MKAIVVIALAVLLNACAAALVPATSDPARKIAWAKELINNQDRPIPAERLIGEALAIYQAENNELGIAEAYRAYGELYKSPAYEASNHYKTQEGYENRYRTALAYYGQALALYIKNEEFFGASNARLQEGFLYAHLGEIAEACRAFQDSLDFHYRGKQAHPEAQVRVPSEFSSFADGIAHFQRKWGC